MFLLLVGTTEKGPGAIDATSRKMLTLTSPLHLATPPPGWTTCGGLAAAYNNTACPTATASCAKQAWMPSEGAWGCCPYPQGVSCGDYTCCPQGTTCENSGSGWSVVSSCVAADGSKAAPGAQGGGQQVCKSGGPLPLSTTKPNVVVLGDSVSIGYTPKVAALMEATALVQHSPWGGDGGAEETHYGWECLDFLLAAPDGTPQQPDVLYFNFGLHNLNNSKLPGQAGPVAEYAPYLEKIVAKLAAWAARASTKLLFGITTPMMCDADSDAVVRSNNRAAVAIMEKWKVPTVDLHAAVVGVCGAAPNQMCFNQSTCFCPHCPQADGVGYEYLAEKVLVPAITKLLPTGSAVVEVVEQS